MVGILADGLCDEDQGEAVLDGQRLPHEALHRDGIRFIREKLRITGPVHGM